MQTANDRIRDLEIRHQVNVQRLSSGVLKRLIALLDRADAEIVAKLVTRGATLEGSFTSVRLQKLLDAIRDINRDAHVSVGKELRGELVTLVQYEAGFQRDLLKSVIPTALDVVTPSLETLWAAVTAQPFQGRLLKEWVSELSDAKARRLRDAIRLGVVQGETTDQIVRRVRGTKALNFTDGVMQIGRRGAEAMVRTAVSHTTGAAQEALYAANRDIIAKEQWVSTLDTRTCTHCMALDGKTFDVGKGPKRPVHIGCRCVRVPVTKSWRELGFDFDDLPAGTRASMNGQVSATENYGTWLAKQPAAIQDEALGPARGALFRSGKLPVDRFTNRAGDELTLHQLRKRDAEAFDRAGLDDAIKPPPGRPRDEIATFLEDKDAQRTLLESQMGPLEAHTRVVRRAIDEEGWSADLEPLLGVRHYTGASYQSLNRRAREGLSTADDRKMTALISKGVDDLPRHQTDVWRAPTRRAADADRWWAGAAVGEELDVGSQLQSFSADRKIAETWSGDAKLVFHVRQPSRGAYIEMISQNPGEEEVLLPAGLRYMVVGKRTEGAYRIIDLEIADDA